MSTKDLITIDELYHELQKAIIRNKLPYDSLAIMSEIEKMAEDNAFTDIHQIHLIKSEGKPILRIKGQFINGTLYFNDAFFTDGIGVFIGKQFPL